MSLAGAIRMRDVDLLPSRRDEAWRWSDLRGLVRQLPAPSAAFAGALGTGPFDALADETIIIVNGRGPTEIAVAAGAERRIALRVIAADAGAHAARLRVEVAPGARLTLLESHEGRGLDYAAALDVTVGLAPGARLERIILADEVDTGVVVSRSDIDLAAGAQLAQTALVSGARRQRLETHVTHHGGGASARLDGVYLIGERRHGDLTSVVSHVGVDGRTEQLAKGVVTGQGRGVFQGRITVALGADRTDARMGHHALVLSDRAEVDAKPELEIFADDVACAHGNTVGALDEQALFYARQRGIGEAEARAMLIAAFLGEVVDRIDDSGAREVARSWLERRLAAS